MNNLFLCDEDRAKPMSEVRPLVRMIDQVDADLLALQEVGSFCSLAALNEHLRVPYPHLALLPGNSNRSIHVGFASRYPLRLASHAELTLSDGAEAPLYWYRSREDSVADLPSVLTLQRDLLLAELEVDRQPLAVFTVHLKSRTNPDWQMLPADTMRLAEARTVQRVVADYLERHPRHGLVLLGDFNDTVGSDALAPLRELPLIDPHAELFRRLGRNPSTYWPKRRQRIDRILLSAALAERVVPDSAVIHVSHMARTASDHYPVSLECRW